MRQFLSILILAGLLISPATVIVAQSDSTEIEFWQSVKTSNSPAELEAYLQAYPKGKFAPLAKIRLKKVKSIQQPEKSAEKSPRTAGKAQANTEGPAFKPQKKILRVKIGAWPGKPSRGWMGIRIKNIPGSVATAFKIQNAPAVFVMDVTKHGPAETAGIEAGDVILAIDGVPTEDIQSFLGKITTRSPGDTLSVKLAKLAANPADILKMLQPNVNEDGDGSLTNFFAEIYMNGVGTYILKDEKKGEVLLLKAAEKGHAHSAASLGAMYLRGEGVEKDYALALKWTRKAVTQGNALAMVNLGYMHERGLGVRKDDEEALKWFRKAAEKGQTNAMFNLGIMFETGQGVEKNMEEAEKWYSKAAAKGLDGAKKRLQLLSKTPGRVKAGGSKPSAPSALGDLKNLDKLD